MMSLSRKKYIRTITWFAFLVLLRMPCKVGGLVGNKNRYRQPGRAVRDDRGRGSDSRTRKRKSREFNNVVGNDNGNTNTKRSSNNKQASMLARAFRILYDQGGTTAVLKGCRDTLLDYDAHVLVEAALLAGNPVDGKNGFRSRGVSSGILNALLGCCCYGEDGGDASSRADMAVRLMQAYDAIGQKQGPQTSFEPDLVALSLAYVATSEISAVHGSKRHVGNTDDDNPIAKKFLHRAEEFYPSPPVKSKGESNPTEIHLEPNWAKLEEDYGIQVLQDAEEFVVLSKPSGMVCYHGSGNKDNSRIAREKDKKNNPQRRRKQRATNDLSLEECLLAQGLPLSTLNQEGRGLVHRIDRGTSGCIVMAKTNRMHAFLLTQFFLRQSKKSYSALVCSGAEQLTQNRSSRSISFPIEGRPATSSYSLETSVGKHLTRIKVTTEQGRRHQVRIHCSEALKAPILLDPLYGGQSILSTLMRRSSSNHTERESRNSNLLTKARERQKFCLHASTLQIDAVGINVEAPLPQWWQELEEELG